MTFFILLRRFPKTIGHEAIPGGFVMNDHIIFLDLGLFEVYWFGFFVGCGLLVAAVIYCVLRRLQKKDLCDSLTTVLCAMPVSLFFSRMSYCWFSSASFSGDFSEYFRLSDGGYSLSGALLGVLIILLIRSRKHNDFLQMLDAAVPAISSTIAIGRFASATGGENTGFEVKFDGNLSLPFLQWSETEQEWVLWVGFFEGIAALIIAGLSMVLFMRTYRSDNATYPKGCATLSFMLTYGLSQAFLESMRSDSLFMVTLGFVRVDQIISIVLAVAAVIIICVNHYKAKGFSVQLVLAWLLCAAALVIAFYCEFTMNATYLGVLYLIMGSALAVMWIVSAILFVRTLHAPSVAERKSGVQKPVIDL